MLSRMRDPRTGRPSLGLRLLALAVAVGLAGPVASHYVLAPALRTVLDAGWWGDD